jgi:hypothetical protein
MKRRTVNTESTTERTWVMCCMLCIYTPEG